jgi:hypothetical protein
VVTLLSFANLVFEESGLFINLLLVLYLLTNFVVPFLFLKMQLCLELNKTFIYSYEALIYQFFQFVKFIFLRLFIVYVVNCGILKLYGLSLALMQHLLRLKHLKTHRLGLLPIEHTRGSDILPECLLFQNKVRHLVCVPVVAVVTNAVLNKTQQQRLNIILLQVQMPQVFVSPH